MPSLNRENAKNMPEIQTYIKRQIYKKGFNFNTQAGVVNDFPIVLGGKARRLFGLTVYSDFAFVGDADLISLTINEEKIIDNVVWWDFNGQGAAGNIFKEESYFALPRPLSGSDSVLLQWNSINAHKVHIVFSLSDSVNL